MMWSAVQSIYPVHPICPGILGMDRDGSKRPSPFRRQYSSWKSSLYFAKGGVKPSFTKYTRLGMTVISFPLYFFDETVSQ